MKYTFLLCGVMLLCCVSCSDRAKNQKVLNSVSIDNQIVKITSDYRMTSDTIYMQQIIDSLFYIPLGKTEPNKLIDIQKVFITDSYILVQDSRSGLYMFDRRGHFVRRITEECWGFDVYEPDKLILVAYRKSIKVYNFDGEIIHKKIPLNTETEGIGNFIAAIDSSLIALSIWNHGHESDRLVIIRTDGSIVNTFPNYEKFQSQNPPLVNASRFHRTLFRYQDQIRFHPYYSDTLFTLSNGRLTPVFIEQKLSKVSLERRLEYLGDIDTFERYCQENEAYATRFFESSRFMMVIYNMAQIDQTLPNYLLYDKQTSTLFNYKQQLNFDTGSLHYGIFNDLDGGLPFNPTNISGDFLIESYSAANFIRDYTVGRNLKSCNPDGSICTIQHYDIKSNRFSDNNRQTVIKHIAYRLKTDDNPVLIIAQLKK